jgi:hypothetical protein
MYVWMYVHESIPLYRDDALQNRVRVKDKPAYQGVVESMRCHMKFSSN